MEHVDAIKRGEPPANPDKIVKMMVAADADNAETAPAAGMEDAAEEAEEAASEAAEKTMNAAGEASSEEILNTAPASNTSPDEGFEVENGVSFE